MTEIESNIFETEVKAFNNVYMPQTAQIQIGSTVGHTASVRRTKFFFGYRYMWTRCQLAEPNSMVAAGVRRDVSETPLWMRNLVVNKLEDCGIIPKVVYQYIHQLELCQFNCLQRISWWKGGTSLTFWWCGKIQVANIHPKSLLRLQTLFW